MKWISIACNIVLFIYSFMWQVCGYIPQTLLSQGQDFTEISAQLSTSFFIETFIHAKEKVNDLYVYTGRVVLVT